MKETKKNFPHLPDAIYWVYVLACAGGYFYIGTTTNVERRFSQHKSGTGSAANFTKAHKPVKVLYKAKLGYMSYAEAERYENCVTLEMMLKYGGDKCAGGKYFSFMKKKTIVKLYEKKSDKYKCLITDIIPPAHLRTFEAFRKRQLEEQAARAKAKKKKKKLSQKTSDKKPCGGSLYAQTNDRFRELNPMLFLTPQELKVHRRAKWQKLSTNTFVDEYPKVKKFRHNR